MRATFAFSAAFLALLTAPPSLPGKGDTVRITITGPDLQAPVEIADPAVAVRFPIWSGPGTSSNEPQGLNVDWSQGAVAPPPRDFRIYEVSFTTTPQDSGAYVVRYAIDPVTGHGYVYLPGRSDPEYRNNTRLIYRGIEGKWFAAWNEWERLARPLIAKARTPR